MLNGVTQLFMTKADVLTGFEKIRVCTGYKVDNNIIDHVPYELTEISEPVFTEMKGWNKDLSKIKSINDIPAELENYMKFIEKETGVPITFVSVGPDREQILTRKS